MKSIIYRWINSLAKHQDLRTKNFFLAKTPWPLLTILAIYLYVCVHIGPKFMRNRKPFKLKNCLLVYNVVQMILSCVLCYEFYNGGWNGHYNFLCQPVNYGTDPISLRLARASWLYYIAKLTELLDTLFFVLRKKDRQVSFLHVYHHTSMPFFTFLIVKYYPDINIGNTRMKSIIYRWINSLVKHQDLRTKNFFLAKTPWPLLTILAIYLYVCVHIGPKFMRDRKPFKLKNCLLVYNVVQMILSCVLCYEFYNGGWNGHYNLLCQPVNYGTDPISLRLARASWLYYIAKLTELLDTLFFVLRKKDRQVSFLHVYHHTSMPFFTFLIVKYYPGGHASLCGLINSFVHVIMYTYYLLAALGPQMQKYLWWKKYITVLQLAQFCIAVIHMSLVLFQPNCRYPKSIAAFFICNSLLFIYMFGMFYIQSYNKSKKQSSVLSSKQEKCN